MPEKRKRYLTAMMISIICLFVWIFVAVLLTDGREAEDFTPRDKQVMTVFIVVEVATAISTFAFACLAGRELGRNRSPAPPIPKKHWEKTARAQSTGIAVAALVIAFGVHILGLFAGKALSGSAGRIFRWALWASFGIGAVLPVVNVFLNRAYIKDLENQKVGDLICFIVSHRDAAEQTALEKQRFLRNWRRWTALYAQIPLLLGICAAFSGGVLYKSETSTLIVMLSALLILCTLSRIRFAPAETMYEEEEAYIKEADYPCLYAVIKRAAEKAGSSDRIRVALMPDYRAGIILRGDVCELFLGVLLLNTLSEDELYHILLHEFTHAKKQTGDLRRAQSLYDWISGGRTPHFGSGITELFFRYFDGVYHFQYNLYRYAASIQEETEADLAMSRWGDAQVAASALLKIKYYELFSWESEATPEKNIYTEEKPVEDMLTRQLERFQQAIQSRQEQWNVLIEKEILSRSASHPTMKMRLQMLGVAVPRVMVQESAEAYGAECGRCLTYVEKKLCEQRQAYYEEEREQNYLEPKTLVEDWEKAGKPLVAEEYGQIVQALHLLCRMEDMVQLCQRAIDELSPAAACQGYFIRGCYRLYCYEDAGIDDIYFAIENNKNYLDEGLQLIGNYCCLTGNQEALEIYRKRSVEYSQADKDMYSQIGVLSKNDRLSSEKLPEGMLEEILAYIRSVEDGQIENIYLVRKTITDTFFTSAMVVRFAEGAEEEECQRIMQKIFAYLDTASGWQFSLFDYRDVARVKVEKIDGSCVYAKNNR